jgi:DNA-binding MarR family transcriptional regulator
VAEPRGPLRSPGFWLHHAALAWRHQVDVRLADLGLTHTQFDLLASANWLSRGGGTPTQQQVADMAGADRMMASKVLAALEQRALLRRDPHPADTRAKTLTVTDGGRELVRRAARVVAEVDEFLFGPESPERDQLCARLRELATADGRLPVRQR